MEIQLATADGYRGKKTLDEEEEEDRNK